MDEFITPRYNNCDTLTSDMYCDLCDEFVAQIPIFKQVSPQTVENHRKKFHQNENIDKLVRERKEEWHRIEERRFQMFLDRCYIISYDEEVANFVWRCTLCRNMPTVTKETDHADYHFHSLHAFDASLDYESELHYSRGIKTK